MKVEPQHIFGAMVLFILTYLIIGLGAVIYMSVQMYK